jgi:TldD protein
MAFAGEGSEQMIAGRAVGITGGWKELFQHQACQNMVEETAKEAIDLLKAKHAPGGDQTVILAPALVGLLCHEAIGHTVEADFVQAGSVAQGKIGQRVGSELVNIYDSGQPTLGANPAGWIPFDDEGVICQSTPIIEQGILKNYLHDRESAALHSASPKGNARAWSYSDEPLIRMTNTWLAPGTESLEEMISSTENGLLVLGAGSGQADATGEFMFGSSCAREIKNGQLGELFREVTLSGIAFDVLQTVDALSNEFLWDLGSGYCGKGQAAKVDAGGPYARCNIKVGGRQT